MVAKEIHQRFRKVRVVRDELLFVEWFTAVDRVKIVGADLVELLFPIGV